MIAEQQRPRSHAAQNAGSLTRVTSLGRTRQRGRLWQLWTAGTFTPDLAYYGVVERRRVTAGARA